jgi:chromosome segregation ATPase
LFLLNLRIQALQIKLANKLEHKEQEIKELKEILQMEKQENDQLRQEIEDNEKLVSEEIEQIKIENDLLKSQRDEYFNQIQVANERRFALEKQVSDFELVTKDLKVISASSGDHIDSLQAEISNLQQERNTLVGKVEELSISTVPNSEFSLQELLQATQNFSESLKIGEGGFGPVYKGSLHQTTVAVKLLHSQSLQGISQFQQEVNFIYGTGNKCSERICLWLN